MICVTIDSLVPCLKDTLTGDIVETEVIRVKRKSFLQKFNKKLGGIQPGEIWQMAMRYLRLL